MSTPILPSLVVDGLEVLNGYRTTAYLNLGLLNDSRIEHAGALCCSVLWRDLDSPQFTTPALDDAPWYTAAEPESGSFLGGYVTGEVADAPIERPFEQRAGDGANLGIERVSSRTLTFKATLFGATPAALQYGLRWLAGRLATTSECASHSVTLRFACPPEDGSDDGRSRYTLYDVALDATIRDTTEQVENAGFTPWAVIEWTMVAADGWLYTDPSDCLASRLLVPEDAAGSVSLEAWLGLTHDPPRHSCELAAPTTGVLAPIVTITAGPDRDVTDVYVHTNPGSYPAPSDYPWPGDYPMLGSLDSDCFPSPAEFPAPDIYPCLDDEIINVGEPLLPVNGAAHRGIRITRIPAGQTLVVDAARRVATLLTADSRQQDGAGLLAAPDGAVFGWPRADWDHASRVVVEAGGYASDDGTALVTVQTRNRQR